MVRLPIEGTLAQYDANAKVVLSNLQILARLLQSCIPEFADVSVQQIIDGAIRKDEIKQGVPLDVDESNLYRQSVRSENTEHTTMTEGTVRFDLLVPVKSLKSSTRYLVDIEMQKGILTPEERFFRGIYYLCRIVSMQKTVEFQYDDYKKMSHCYGIWICPYEKENYIVENHMVSIIKFGKAPSRNISDIIAMIEIGVGDTEPVGNDFCKILYTLFKEKIPAKMKIEKLKRYGIIFDSGEKEGVMKMETLGEVAFNYFVERAKKEAQAEAKEEGKKEGKREAEVEVKNDIALRLLKKRYALDDISFATDIPESVLKDMAKKNRIEI